MDNNTVILVKNLSKCYRIYNSSKARLKELLFVKRKSFHRQFWAIKDVSFEVKKGECIGIIGRNGSGKSTLLQLICGILVPNHGTIEINGKIAALLELGSGFHPEFTGRENVYMNAAILGLTRKETDEKYDEIVEFADIGEFVNQPVKTFSSGMFIRLAFAVSINVNPDILVIDEALAVGDAAFQVKCYEKLDQLRNNGATILFVSHDTGAIKNLCTGVVYLNKGSVQAIGIPSETVEQYWFDMRVAQRVSHKQQPQVKIKSSIGQGNGFSFGTSEGKILRTEFTGARSNHSVFHSGEKIQFRVEVEFLDSIKNPALSVIIQDRKLIEIGGRFFRLSRDSRRTGINRNTFQFTFTGALAEGSYVVTLRLEDRIGQDQFFPIDKQVSALAFEIESDAARDLVGLVDFQLECRELEQGPNQYSEDDSDGTKQAYESPNK